MKKIYHLSTCSTCQRIIKELDPSSDVLLQDIKTEKITATQLEELKDLAGSYEALFSRRAMKYRSFGLNDMQLEEDDYKKYIVEEYTFLKRPVILIEDSVFIGNSKKVVEKAKDALNCT